MLSISVHFQGVGLIMSFVLWNGGWLILFLARYIFFTLRYESFVCIKTLDSSPLCSPKKKCSLWMMQQRASHCFDSVKELSTLILALVLDLQLAKRISRHIRWQGVFTSRVRAWGTRRYLRKVQDSHTKGIQWYSFNYEGCCWQTGFITTRATRLTVCHVVLQGRRRQVSPRERLS